jgi:thymidylate synthase (FAD)
MEIIKPYFVIENDINAAKILRNLEIYGRVCYKSEDKINQESSIKFLKGCIKRGHLSLIEHENITVRFICDRGITHEIVRHRLASYSQESTRYVNYNKKGTEFIDTFFWSKEEEKYKIWKKAMEKSEFYYNKLIELGASPQQARSVLPNSTKTEIVVTANIREWRHILKLRTSKFAHPQMREIMIPLLYEFKRNIPVLFDDINYDDENGKYILNQYTDDFVDWKYIAGILDGEGTVYIGKNQVRISIYNTDIECINRIRSFLCDNKIQTNISSRKRKKTHKECYNLSIDKRDSVELFMDIILPYTIIKKEKIIKAIEKLDRINKKNNKEFTEKEIELIKDKKLSSRKIASLLGCSCKKILKYRKNMT